MKKALEKLLAHPEFRKDEHWRLVTFHANDTILEQGEESQTIFQLKQGVARVVGRVNTAHQKAVKPGVYEILPGEVFGEISLFDHEPRSASVMAVEDCEVYEIDGQMLMTFIKNYPDIGVEFLQALVKTLVGRLRKTNKKVFSLLAWGLKVHQIEDHL